MHNLIIIDILLNYLQKKNYNKMANWGGKTMHQTVKPKGGLMEDEDVQIIQKFEFVPKGVFIMNITSTMTNTFILSSMLIFFI